MDKYFIAICPLYSSDVDFVLMKVRGNEVEDVKAVNDGAYRVYSKHVKAHVIAVDYNWSVEKLLPLIFPKADSTDADRVAVRMGCWKVLPFEVVGSVVQWELSAIRRGGDYFHLSKCGIRKYLVPVCRTVICRRIPLEAVLLSRERMATILAMME